MRILAYCLMPNPFHFVVLPEGDGDLSRWMQWLPTSHVRRYPRLHFLAEWPISRPSTWLDELNRASASDDLEGIRNSIRRGAPYGQEAWSLEAAARHRSESTLRRTGRPRGGGGSGGNVA